MNNNILGLRVENNRVAVSSRDVARVCEKEHKHVLRDIRELGCSENFIGSNFELNEYRDAKGEESSLWDAATEKIWQGQA